MNYIQSEDNKEVHILLEEKSKIWEEKKFLKSLEGIFRLKENNESQTKIWEFIYRVPKNKKDFQQRKEFVLKKYIFRFWHKYDKNYNPQFTVNIENIKNVSLVIGKEAYGDLTRTMLYSTKEIKIISPFLSVENLAFCNSLFENNPNLKIKLLTSLDKNKLENMAFGEILQCRKQENLDLKHQTQKEIERKEQQKKLEEDILKANKDKKKKLTISIKEIKEKHLKKFNRLRGIMMFSAFAFSYWIISKGNFLSIKIFFLIGILFWVYYFINSWIRKKEENIENNSSFLKEKEKIDNLELLIKEIERKINQLQEEIRSLQEKKFFYLDFHNVKENFEFKVVSKELGKPYPHVKMYIVDDIVYLGSLNFSKTAFLDNIESLIKIEDKDAVIKLSSYFDELYTNKDFLFLTKEEIGNALYKNILPEN